MTAQKRTLLGILLFTPLAAVLLTTFACLPAPVGDPETATIDEKLTGAWQGVMTQESDKNKTLLVTLRPWDKHTWILQYLVKDPGEHEGRTTLLNYKAWVTSLNGTPFLSCEALDNYDFLGIKDDNGEVKKDHYYWVAKLEFNGDQITVSGIKNETPLLKDKDSRQEIEEIIKANVDNKELYDTPLTFKKLGADALQKLHDLRKEAGIGFDTLK